MRRLIIYALIASVVAVALMAILFVLTNKWGWFEIRIAVTAVICTVSSLCVLACSLSRTSSGQNFLSNAGLVLVFLATPLCLVEAWASDSFMHQHQTFYRVTNVIVIFALATVHVCLLSMARLQKRFAWVFALAVFVSYALAFLASYYNFLGYDGTGFEPQHNRDVLRWIYALIVTATAMTAIVPLLHVLSRGHGNRDA
jgi:hypothetical protein